MSNERLVAGEKAPYFKTLDVMGNMVDLNEYKGKRVLLSFYRFVTCPLCNLRVAQFMRQYPQFKDDIAVIAIFESSQEYITDYIGPKGLPFPIIADPNAVLFKHFGVEKSWFKSMLAMLKPLTMMKAMWNIKFRMGPRDGSANRVPADFLIDTNGALRVCHYGANITDHIPMKLVEKFMNMNKPHANIRQKAA
ncbi:MAG: redoxin domain-containing protein [Gammaproteobacteria bacterium]